MRGKTCLWLIVFVTTLYLGSRSACEAEQHLGEPQGPAPANATHLSRAAANAQTDGGPLSPLEEGSVTVTTTLTLDVFYVGNENGCELGYAVSGAGDVNGDGFAEVLVGAPAQTGSVAREGLVTVYYGSATGLPSAANLTLGAGQKGSRFGAAVSGDVDVNGDGFADIIVGAPQYWIEPVPGTKLTDAGAVFVYHGSASGLSAAPDWSFYGDQARAKVGASVSSAGDVNGDGFGDILISAPFYGSASEGAVFLFYGSESGLRTDNAQIIAGNRAAALFGAAIASAGDINSDGYADIIVGAPHHSRSTDLYREGAAFVYLGSEQGLAVTAAWQVYGGQPELFLGAAVTGVGDANADGCADIAIGAPGYDGDEIDQGLVHVFYGSQTGLSADPNWSYTYAQAGFRIGATLSSAGDVNADGYADLLVGAPSYPAPPDGSQQNIREAALVFLGTPYGLMHTYTWYLETNQSTTNYGAAVASAGRTNFDGFDDIIIGAPQYKSNQDPVGRAFVYLGQAFEPVRVTVFLPVVVNASP